ncbi:hypothetical protein [Jannaschia aquimarina]|uniref:Autotransporter domain-containing protein n=2 Tax=Jannaschia aquimarina TaxID=935700 RepID=A0A0D1EE00_9RHOB|nr:hypothetical protein [Jannaschia aquimarina]KIT15151.1 hypothetical protein jaqu_31200 [Jannaschia aquimarina]SNT23724.1 hypothetical protein SAMN05421775_108143 [Jannaschia aquimarina]
MPFQIRSDFATRSSLLGATALAALLVTSPVLADDFRWTGNTNSDYTGESGNWTESSGFPDQGGASGDDVLIRPINSGRDAPVLRSGQTVDNRTVTVRGSTLTINGTLNVTDDDNSTDDFVVEESGGDSGTVIVGGTGTLASDISVTGGELDNRGQVTGDITVTGGRLESSGAVTGAIRVESGGQADIQGGGGTATVSEAVVNAGGTMTIGAATIGTVSDSRDLQNSGGGELTVDGTTVVTDDMRNTDTGSLMTIDSGASLTVGGEFTNRADAVLDIDGDVTATTVQNEDAVLRAGGGTITGALRNQSGGQATVDDALTVTDLVTNTGSGGGTASDLTIAEGQTLTAPSGVLNEDGATLDIDGTIQGTGGADTSVTNDDALTEFGSGAGATITGTLTNQNGGRVQVLGTAEVSGAITNTGENAGGTASEFAVDEGETLTAGGGILNEAGGFLDLDGTVQGSGGADTSVTNDDATMEIGSGAGATLTGTLTNRNGGQVTVVEATEVTGLVTNTGANGGGTASEILVDRDRTLTAGSGILNEAGASLDVNGTVQGTGGAATTVTNDNASVAIGSAPGATITGNVINQNGGQVSAFSNGAVTGGIVSGGADSTVNIASGADLAADIVNESSSAVEVLGRLDGTVTNRLVGSADIDGIVTGQVTNNGAGSILTAGGGTIGDVRNEAGGQATIDDNLQVTGVARNTGTGSSLTINNGVTLTGDVSNEAAGQTTQRGGVTGAVTNDAAAYNLDGATITGTLTNRNGGTATVVGSSTVNGTGTVTNTGLGTTLAVQSGQTLTAGEVRNLDSATLDLDGRIDGDVVNESAFTLDGGRIDGTLTNRNAGDVDVTANSNVTRTVNQGAGSTVDISSGVTLTGDLDTSGSAISTIAGTLSGDLDTSPGGQTNVVGTGIVTGATRNEGTFDSDGDLRGNVTNTNGGQANLGNRVGGSLRNEAGADVTVDGPLNVVSGVTNAGSGSTFEIGAGDVLTTTTLETENQAITRVLNQLVGRLVGRATSETVINGTVTGDVVMEGDLTATGLITGELDIRAGGDAVLSGNLQVDGDTRVRQSGSSLTVGGGTTLTSDVRTANEGLLDVDGTVSGQVRNDGELEAQGIISGLVTNEEDGVASATGPLALNGGLQNDGSFTVQTGTTSVTSVTQNATGSLSVENGAELSVAAGTAVLDNAGEVRNAGTLSVSRVENRAGGDFIQEATGSTDTLVNAGDADLAGTLGTFTNRNGGSAETTGTLTVTTLTNETGAEFTVGNGTTTATTITNTGTITVSDGAALTRPVGSITNDGTLNLSGTVNTTQLLNRGTLNATTTGVVAGDLLTSGNADLAGRVNGAFSNTGTAETVGNLTLGGTAQNSGGFVISGGDTVTNSAGAFVNTGTATVDGVLTGALDNRNGLTLSGRVGGTLGNSGTISVTGDSTVVGALSNGASGRITIDDGATLEAQAGLDNANQLTIDGTLDGDLTNASRTTLAGGDVEGRVTNQAGATLTSSGASAITGPVTNAGTLNVTGGTLEAGSGVINNNALTISDGATLDGAVTNTSNLTVAGTVGALTLNGGVANVTGTVDGQTTVRNGARLDVAGAALQGGTTVDAGALVNIDGDTSVAGSLTNRGTIDGTTSGSVLNLNVRDTFTNEGTVRNDGGSETFVVDAGTFVLSDTSVVSGNVELRGAIRNEGTIVYNEDTELFGNLENAPGGDIDVSAELDATGRFISNEGTFDVTGTGSVVGVETFTTAGSGVTTIAAGGVIEGGEVVNQSAGSGPIPGLSNAGTIDADLSNEAGATAVSTGIITGDVANEGTLTAGGTIGGQLTGAGETELSGNLTVAGGVATAGDLTVASGQTLTTPSVTMRSGGALNLDGTVAGSVTGEAGSGLTINDGTVTGNLVVGGTGALSGSIGGNATVATGADLTFGGATSIGGVLNTGGTTTIAAATSVENGVTNSGTLAVNAALDGDVESDGTLTFGAGSSVSGSVNVQGGTAVASGDLSVGSVVAVAASGDLTVAGDLTGNLLNTGTAVLDGDVTGNVTSTGTTTFTGPATVDGSLGVDNGMTTGSVLAVTNGVSVGANGMLTADTLLGSVTNAGVAEFDEVRGDVLNTGSRFAASTVGGDLIDQAGTLDFDGDLTVGGRLETSTDLDIGTGEVIRAGSALLSGQVDLAGRLEGDFTTTGALSFASASSRVQGSLTNRGTLDATNGGIVTGTLGGDGTVDLVDGAVGDVLTVGALAGDDTRLSFDIDLSGDAASPADAADRIQVATGGITGSFIVSLNPVGDLNLGDLAEDVVLIEANGSGPTNYSFTLDSDGPVLDDGRIIYTLNQASDGSLLLVDQISPLIAAVASNVALTQSLIGSLVNRPTSPYVVGYALEQEDPCGTGLWSRATAGAADVSGDTSDSVNRLSAEIDVDYAGIQLGGDFACFQGYFGGWDLAFGGIGGLNSGTTSQPVLQLSGTTSDGAPALRTVTESDFDQAYLGLYVSAARGPLFADLQIRQEKTDFVFNNNAAEGSLLSLDDAELETSSTTISGSVSRAFSLGESGWTVVPTGGFSITKTGGETLQFSDENTTLELDDQTLKLGFVGTTLSRTQVAESGKWLANYFATGTYYNDFSGSLTSTFESVDQNGDPFVEELSSDPLGSYGELSVGLNYVRILDGTRGKQFNASARLDARKSGNLSSVGLTAQARWQF